MNFRMHFRFLVLTIGLMAAVQFAQAQTTGDGAIAKMSVGAGTVRWDMLVPNAGGSITVSFPDGRSIKRAFKNGSSPEISLSDKQLDGLPDGVYSYELRVAPQLSGAQKEAMAKARGNDDDPESERSLRRRPVVGAFVQTGSFAILNGNLIGPGSVEGGRTASNRAAQPSSKAQTVTPARPSANTVSRIWNHRFSLAILPDDVIADDLIVQGSACVGLDCVINESFGFDTLRLKENNDRIQFDDTSTSSGFPNNNWQIRANSSSSGGASFLAFVDQGSTGNSETGTIVFEVDAGAPANAIKVGSNGKMGIKTATPVLDVHVNTSDTPAFRMEQNNSGGFTAQTWDIGANEANWFVRDVTGGSRLPLRIRPGAPTSSIDIAATGNVGINTASPGNTLDVVGTLRASGAATFGSTVGLNSVAGSTRLWLQGDESLNRIFTTGGIPISIEASGTNSVQLKTNSSTRVLVDGSGNVGIATISPTDTLSVNGTASKPGGGSWAVFSDERLKNITGRYTSGLNAVMQLQPIRYRYRQNNPLHLDPKQDYVGFGAQTLSQVVPEAVSQNANGYLEVNNDPIMWTMLNAIKEQQQEIEQLKVQIRKLRTSAHRHHK
jgi:hypothetical protein